MGTSGMEGAPGTCSLILALIPGKTPVCQSFGHSIGQLVSLTTSFGAKQGLYSTHGV